MGGEDLKNKTHLVTAFALGVVVFGVIARGTLVKSQSSQSAGSVKTQSCQISRAYRWQETDDDTRCRMLEFQRRLETLEMHPIPDDMDRLTKEMEAQRGIYDILTKFREAQQAKFVSFQTLAAGVLGAIVTLVTQRLTSISKSR